MVRAIFATVSVLPFRLCPRVDCTRPASCGYAQRLPFRDRWAHKSKQPLVASAATPACRA